jgi:hypothetical protein
VRDLLVRLIVASRLNRTIRRRGNGTDTFTADLSEVSVKERDVFRGFGIPSCTVVWRIFWMHEIVRFPHKHAVEPLFYLGGPHAHGVASHF